MYTMKKYSWDGGTTRLPVNDEAGRKLLKDTVGFTGKNRAYSQENNAVIASIESGKTYSVSWTGSATITLKKDSASGTEITSGSTSPLTFTADADYDLYFGSSDDVTQIMVCDSALDGEYEDYHDSVETMFEEEIHGVNLLKMPYDVNGGTNRGITFTGNSSGSFNFSGTPDNSLPAYIRILEKIPIKAGTYKMNGGNSPYGGISIQLFNLDGTNYTGGGSGLPWGNSGVYTTKSGDIYGASNEYGYEKTFTINTDALADFQVRSVTNIITSAVSGVIYPMLYKADLDVDSFKPYNQQSIQHQINNITGVTGVRNRLDLSKLSTETKNGITCTVTRDSKGNVTEVDLNGTATAASTFMILPHEQYRFEEGTWILSDVNGSNSAYTFIARKKGASGTEVYLSTKNGEKLFNVNYTEYDYYYVGIYVPNGSILSHVKLYPMIRSASDPDDTYVPYAMTNRELTERSTIAKTENVGSMAINACKEGNMVSLFFDSMSVLAQNYATDDVILTLPKSLWPAYTISFRESLNNKRLLIEQGTGKIKAKESLTSGSSIRGVCTYISK